MTEQATMPRPHPFRAGKSAAGKSGRSGKIAIKLTFQSGKGWRKDVGKKRWWLGHDKPQALRLAELIVAKWQLIAARGGNAWNDQAVRRIQDAKFAFTIGQPLPGEPIAASAEPPPVAVAHATIAPLPPATVERPGRVPARSGSAAIRLHKATDEFLALKRAEVDAGQTTAGHYSKIAHAVRRFRDHFGNVPLETIGYQRIRSMISNFVGRPVSASTERPLAPATVMDTITAARSFFQHAADSQLWTAPTTFKRLFAYQRRRLADEVEQQRLADVQVFTVPELRALWYEMPAPMNVCFCLGLNCGFTQREIATLKRSHCRLDTERPYIVRKRNKTNVTGKWRLWPETAELLRAAMAGPNENDLALLDDAGKPLFYNTGLNRRDRVFRQWERVRGDRDAALQRFHGLRAEYERTRGVRCHLPGLPKRIRKLPFKPLRKTGSNLVRQASDRDTAEVFLAHADPTMGKYYHKPDFKKLAKALRKVRRMLAPVFDAAKNPVTVEPVTSATKNAG
jgi:integrase